MTGPISLKPDPTPDAKFALRRQRTFLFLSGIFLGTLTMLNLLGISRFLDASFEIFGVTVPIVLAVGVLPYPITFLCTDLIGELFGRKRASDLVLMGLILNLWVVFILWLGGALPGFEPIDPATGLPVIDEGGRLPVFFEVRNLTYGSVLASMIAYLTAQYCDVRLFHFWKWLTGGRYLWIRNNGSTLVSQLVDTVAVVLVTAYVANALPVDETRPMLPQLMVFIWSGYIYKLTVALIDTGPAYAAIHYLRPLLGLKQNEEIDPNDFGKTVVFAGYAARKRVEVDS